MRVRVRVRVRPLLTFVNLQERMEESAARMAQQRKRLKQAERLREQRGEEEEEEESSLERSMLRDLMDSVDLRWVVIEGSWGSGAVGWWWMDAPSELFCAVKPCTP